MAKVCTTARSVCYHEPIKSMTNWREVYDLWEEPGYVGVADSAMGFHLREILDRAAPRTLLIVRDIHEVEHSLRMQGLPSVPRYCQVLQERIEALRSHPLVLLAKFEELNDADAVAICMRHLMPDLRVDMTRVDQLMDVNIQADVEEIRAELAQRPPDLENLLGADVMREILGNV